ncbi:MAG: L-asparaginase [Nitrospinales bacterium]|jgi:L-asparaginase
MKIAFIQTGGTIDKDYPQITKGWAFEISDPAFVRILDKLNPSFDYEVLSAMKKDSTEITSEDRDALKAQIENLDASHIIITHGTDTMEETAQALSEIKSKTIVITGAMRPQRFANTDADINLGLAIGAVQSKTTGVFICMHGLVIPWDKVDRNMETGKYIIKN